MGAALRSPADEAVQELDISMFGPSDVVNLILQRSGVLQDVPLGGQLIQSWSEGDGAPLMELAEERGEVLIRRALAEIYEEYRSLSPHLQKIAPKRIADIGCGYGIFDVFAARELGSALLLIDIEQSETRHFGFNKTGSAYSDLAVARAFALANGVSEDGLVTLNPLKDDLSAAGSVDLAVSFISCGFHYPVAQYMPFFREQLRAGGHLILDLRAGRKDGQMRQLSELGTVSVISERPGVVCVQVGKAR